MHSTWNPNKDHKRHFYKYSYLFGRYCIKKTLGSGEFSTVKAAVDMQTGLRVAVKQIKPDKLLPEELEILKRIMSLEKLKQCPYLLQTYDIKFDSENIYIISELISDGDLFNYINNKKRIPLDEAKTIFQQLIYCLNVLHEENICHRDLKPENILIKMQADSNTISSIKIADFGFSKRFNDGDLLSKSCGSPNYAAPEIIKHLPYCGQSIDVWSSGVILYAMLYGHLPFDDPSNNISRLFEKISAGLFKTNNTVPRAVNELLRNMMCVDPIKRITLQKIAEHPWFQNNLPDHFKSRFPYSVFSSKTTDTFQSNSSSIHNNSVNTQSTPTTTPQNKWALIPCTPLPVETKNVASTDENPEVIMNGLYSRLIQLGMVWKNSSLYNIQIIHQESGLHARIRLYAHEGKYVWDFQLINGSNMEFLTLSKELFSFKQKTPPTAKNSVDAKIVEPDTLTATIPLPSGIRH